MYHIQYNAKIIMTIVDTVQKNNFFLANTFSHTVFYILFIVSLLF